MLLGSWETLDLFSNIMYSRGTPFDGAGTIISVFEPIINANLRCRKSDFLGWAIELETPVVWFVRKSESVPFASETFTSQVV